MSGAEGDRVPIPSKNRARNSRLTNKVSLQLEKNLSEELQGIALRKCDHKVREQEVP